MSLPVGERGRPLRNSRYFQECKQLHKHSNLNLHRSRIEKRRCRVLVKSCFLTVMALIVGSLYAGDSETFATVQCRILHEVSHFVFGATHSKIPQFSQSWFGCCSVPPLRSARNPVIRTASAGPISLNAAPDGAQVCVYGEAFGWERGASGISVGGVALSDYSLWTDPGEPYGDHRLAAACGILSRWTPTGASEVVVTTAGGISNAVLINVENGFSGLATTSGQRSRETSDALESQNRESDSQALAPR